MWHWCITLYCCLYWVSMSPPWSDNLYIIIGLSWCVTTGVAWMDRRSRAAGTGGELRAGIDGSGGGGGVIWAKGLNIVRSAILARYFNGALSRTVVWGMQSSIAQCLSQGRINWEGCSMKDVQLRKWWGWHESAARATKMSWHLVGLSVWMMPLLASVETKIINMAGFLHRWLSGGPRFLFAAWHRNLAVL